MIHKIDNNIPEIEAQLRQRVNTALSRHAKVMVVRYDLRFPDNQPYFDHSRYLSSFLNKLRHKLKHKGYDPIDFWVREQNYSLNPHYHCLLLLNGHKVQSLYGIFPVIESLWASIIGDSNPGLVEHCRQCTDWQINLNGCRLTRNNEQLYRQCLDWLEYMAKEYSKGNAPPHIREYGGSRISGAAARQSCSPFSFQEKI